jgi:DNA-binding NarL/FixJ family response regulator
MMPTLLLVDDDHRLRQGLRMRLALEPDLVVVGEADDGTEAVQRAIELAPDIVVMDVEMPNMDGIAAIQSLRRQAPSSAVVVLSIHDDEATRARAIAAGAAAFVAKHDGPDVLLATLVRTAARSKPP